MTAGRELDALVAEKVMGWHLKPHPKPVEFPLGALWEPVWWCDENEVRKCRDCEFSPSTSIAAAWEVVEKLSEQYDWRLDLDQSLRDDRPHMKYLCTFYRRVEDDVVAVPVGEEFAPTAPLAICLAALKAVGYTFFDKPVLDVNIEAPHA